MSKLVKDLITNELQDRYAALDSALWVELVGADGHVTNDFRRALRSKQMRIEIVKTSLFRRATAESKLRPLAEKLNGPSAIVTGGDSVIDAAKVVEEWLPKIEGLKLRGAILEGELIPDSDIAELSKMPTKADMQARVAGMVLSPGGKLASAINAGGANIAGCLKAIIKKFEDAEGGEAAAA